MQKEIKILEKENVRLKNEVEKLKELITIDFLTQVNNRHSFSQLFKRVCKETKWVNKYKTRRQRGNFFSLILIDIDNFKQFNDKFGHLYGDKILKKVAKMLGYVPFSQKSWTEFDIEDYYRIIENQCKKELKEKYGY